MQFHISTTNYTSVMPRVAILLSTYNGVKYLDQQLQSLVMQNDVSISLYIRDDGSQDGTRELLLNFAEKCQYPVFLFFENNIGASSSYLKLIEYCGDEYDYYAFCDQDDYWKNTKLIKGINYIKKNQITPNTAYFSRLIIANSYLKPKKLSRKPKIISFENSLIENKMTGCTIILSNKSFILVKNHLPDKVIMHDFWIYLVFSTFGSILYDNNSYIYYRQHENNVIGDQSNIINFLKRIKVYIFSSKKKYRNYDQALEFFSIFKDIISKKDIKSLKRFIGYKNNIHDKLFILFSRKYVMDSIFQTLLFKTKILLNKF